MTIYLAFPVLNLGYTNSYYKPYLTLIRVRLVKESEKAGKRSK
jgi:hypothetical protein